VRFSLLGPVTITYGDISASVGRSQRRGLLAYLLLHHGRWLSVDTLTEALWGGAEPASARQQIQTSVHAIRSQLRRLGAPGVLDGGASGYRLDVGPHEVDVDMFGDLVARARECPAVDAEPHLVAALDLWRGTALADASGAFVEAARAGLEDRRIAATEDLLDVRLGLGRQTEVLATLGQLLIAHPLRERLRSQQMLALYREGRQVEALEAFRAFREQLADEHGLDPHPDLQGLERAILAGDPALDLRPPVDGVTAAEPAARALPEPAQLRLVVPAQLPAAASAFIGREAELAKLDEALAAGRAEADRPAAVLINAVDGEGGVGKTATAVTWAHRIRDQFPDGQLYLNMHGYSTMPAVRPLEALSRLLDALGVPPEQVPVELDAAASLYRTRMAGRRMLILIDNVNDVDQVRPLLPGHAGCLVLVTSRARLTGLIAREGARRVSLGGLHPDEAVGLLARIVGEDRVAAEPEAAGQIVAACAYLPLALRVVAANLCDKPHTTLAEYAASLGRPSVGRPSLDAFEVDGDPQASVRVALGQSYRALDAGHRRLFRLLGLVPGPDVTVTTAAALAELSADDAAQGLERLANTHLVDESVPGRFAMHDLVRFFARERAETEESAAGRDRAVSRLFGFYLSSLDRVAGKLYPQTVRLLPLPLAGVVADEQEDAGAAMAWVEANLTNLVAAVRWAVGHDYPRAAAELADAVRGFFWVRRHMADWLEVAQAAEVAARQLADDRLLTAAGLSLGMAHRTAADYTAAAQHLELALAASRRSGWVEAEASALGSIAIVHGELSDFGLAIRRLTEALEINRRIGRKAGEAVTRGNLGSFRQRAGDLPAALADSLAALTLYREVGSPGGEAIVLANLGATSALMGNYPQGLRFATEALALQERIGDQSGASLALLVRAQIRVDMGQVAAAAQDAVRAVELSRASQDVPREADAITVYGLVLLAGGDPGRALQEAVRGAELANSVTAATQEADSWAVAARCLLRLGRPSEAVAYARRALAVARDNSLLVASGQSLTTLAHGLVDEGRWAEAMDSIREAIVVHRASGHRPGEARTYVVLGRLHVAAARPEAAVRAWTQALELFETMGAVEASRVRELLSTMECNESTMDAQASVRSGPSTVDVGSAGTG
jgi:DNA-binding SARP family transcriptional activator